MEFSSNKPYLIHAIYEWVMDNDATPHIVIFADNPEVIVPQQFVENGKIILNISPTAAQELIIDEDGVSFSARFAGKPHSIFTPLNAVMAIYASENGEGMSFDIEAENNSPPPSNPPKGPSSIKKSPIGLASSSPAKKSSKRPSLKVVK